MWLHIVFPIAAIFSRNQAEGLRSCDSNPCLNGGTCIEDPSGKFHCNCPTEFVGETCQQPNPCYLRSGPRCQNGGTCVVQTSSSGDPGFSCLCPPGFSHSLCEIPTANPCIPSPCLNGGKCVLVSLDEYTCYCPAGFSGRNCEGNNACRISNPCVHGKCIPRSNGTTQCICDSGFAGTKCDTPSSPCSSSPCSNGGSCVSIDSTNYTCKCLPGFSGRSCEQQTDYCSTNPCQNGATCINSNAGYSCICGNGWTGRNCSQRTNKCTEGVCLNGGTCYERGANVFCYCPPGKTGLFCHLDDGCASTPCHQSATCYSYPFNGSYSCLCAEGFRGIDCKEDIDECNEAGSLCEHGGTCINTPGSFHCDCTQGFMGPRCETNIDECLSNPCQNAATCLDHPGAFRCICLPGYTGTRCEIGICDSENCRQKSGDGKCDLECNSQECDYDGGDCSLGVVDPWASCDPSLRCRDLYNNSRCNEECNTPQCLYDGFDCAPKPVSCFSDTYCKANYNNGVCDQECHNSQCGWDGQDCVKNPPLLASGILNVVLRMDVQKFRVQNASFVRYLSQQLRTTVRIKLDHQGVAMIYPWDVRDDPAKASGLSYVYPQSADGVLVYLEIDNSKCSEGSGSQCFGTASQAAGFLAASVSENQNSDFPVVRVSSLEGPSLPENDPINLRIYYFVAGITVVVLGALVGVLVRGNTKKARGKTWFPPGFLNNSTQSQSQEMLDLHKTDVPNGDIESASRPWSAEMSSQPMNPPLPWREPNQLDERAWNKKHCEAIGLQTYRFDSGMASVDVPGPGRMTPLMVASSRGSGLGTEEKEKQREISQIVQVLLQQGANPSAQTEHSGETALHLAARFGCAEAAERLLSAGADPNASDHSGRTPLHAAIAADSSDVVGILVRNRSTNLNARCHEGSTPAILAARLSIEGALLQLIEMGAEVNAADNLGRTALHWAAAVNNTDAVSCLLLHGAYKDAQDSKEETPLFVAAREGSYQAAHILLNHNTVVDIRDHYDRLPRDIAKERLHNDIVLLLDQHIRTPDPAESRSSSQNASKRPKLASLDARDLHSAVSSKPTIPVNSAASSKRNRTKNGKKKAAAIEAPSTASFTIFPNGLYSQETSAFASGNVTMYPSSSNPSFLISPPSSGSVEFTFQHNTDGVSFANPPWENHVTCDNIYQSTGNPQNYSIPLSVDSKSQTSMFQNFNQQGSFQVPDEYLSPPLTYSHFAPQQEFSYPGNFLTPSPESCGQWPFSFSPSSV